MSAETQRNASEIREGSGRPGSAGGSPGASLWPVKVTLGSPAHTPAPGAAGAAGVRGRAALSWKAPGQVGVGPPPRPVLLRSVSGRNKENCVCQAGEPESQDCACHAAPWGACRAPSARVRRPPDLPDQSLQHGAEKPCDGHGFREEQLVSLPEESPGVYPPPVPGPEAGREERQPLRGTVTWAGSGGAGLAGARGRRSADGRTGQRLCPWCVCGVSPRGRGKDISGLELGGGEKHTGPMGFMPDTCLRLQTCVGAPRSRTLCIHMR